MQGTNVMTCCIMLLLARQGIQYTRTDIISLFLQLIALFKKIIFAVLIFADFNFSKKPRKIVPREN